MFTDIISCTNDFLTYNFLEHFTEVFTTVSRFKIEYLLVTMLAK